MILLKNTNLYTPEHVGIRDILIGGDKILAIEPNISLGASLVETIDLGGKSVFPGFIDQHIHIAGAGGGSSFASMTPEVHPEDLIRCGSTTVVGLLGTDGSTRSLQALYAKSKSLIQQGISAYMFTNYYGFPAITLTHSVQDDLIFIDNVLGCKIAISDTRSSHPSTQELARLASQVNVGGMISGKGGILHVHLGNLSTGMDPLFELVEKFQIPIRLLSPTHVGRSEQLFKQAMDFARLGGMIDITTGASRFTEPWKQVMIAIESGVSIDNITFSTDGHAGLSAQTNNNPSPSGIAPVHTNLEQVLLLIREGGLQATEAFKLITCNPAKNLNLTHKGKLELGADADICCFDNSWNLTEVFSRGIHLMHDAQIIIKSQNPLVTI